RDFAERLVISDEQRARGREILAAAGVVFFFLAARNQLAREVAPADKIPDLRQWLDLCALGTLCDMAPLHGVNRAFVRQGMKVMSGGQTVGLRALADVAGISVPKSVTDDLYNALSVVKQGKTMVYDPEVLIKIPMRAKTISQEMTRRRRIVCRSMTGLKKMRSLFNPRQYGLYSWILFSHKLLRRALPLFLIMLWTANSFLIFSHWGFALLFIVQSTLYGLVPLHFIRPKNLPSPALTTWIYFCVGNVGTLMGLLEFLMGKRYEKWNPAKK
ncbi:MAG: hypothetical protein MI749_19080, partial [Desulfovibrionales bacterium]|nr:hypothetical protein [Desulfovibrionales bacterium]